MAATIRLARHCRGGSSHRRHSIGRHVRLGFRLDAIFSVLGIMVSGGVIDLFAHRRLALRMKGFRRIGWEMPEFAAAVWPRGELLIALGIVFALDCATFGYLDIVAVERLSALQTGVSSLALSLEPAKIPDSQNAA